MIGPSILRMVCPSYGPQNFLDGGFHLFQVRLVARPSKLGFQLFWLMNEWLPPLLIHESQKLKSYYMHHTYICITRLLCHHCAQHLTLSGYRMVFFSLSGGISVSDVGRGDLARDPSRGETVSKIAMIACVSSSA